MSKDINTGYRLFGLCSDHYIQRPILVWINPNSHHPKLRLKTPSRFFIIKLFLYWKEILRKPSFLNLTQHCLKSIFRSACNCIPSEFEWSMISILSPIINIGNIVYSLASLPKLLKMSRQKYDARYLYNDIHNITVIWIFFGIINIVILSTNANTTNIVNFINIASLVNINHYWDT